MLVNQACFLQVLMVCPLGRLEPFPSRPAGDMLGQWAAEHHVRMKLALLLASAQKEARRN